MKILIFLLTTVAISFAFGAKLELRVAERSTVRTGDPIRLGPLISNSVNEPELDRKIYDLVVFEPINSETEKTFKSEELALTLRRKLSFRDLQSLSLKIPETFAVKAQRNFLYPSDISRDIRAQAQALCGQCEVQFEDLRIPSIKSKEELLQARLESGSLKGAGGFLLPLHIETSKTRNVFWITGQISFFKEVPVTKRMIRPNERISSDDVEMKRANISFSKDGFPRIEDLSGKIASRTLTKGQPIFIADLKNELAAVRGQALKLLIGNDSFEVSSSGTAEEAGSIGDMIRVKSHDTKKILSGVLVEKGIVRVQ